MTEAYLSLGTNIGNKKQNLLEAFAQISKLGNAAGSHIYRTEPWGKEDVPEFLNACVSVKTELDIKKLFDSLCSIEEKMGRKRKEKWGNRVIDIDFLLTGQTIFKSPSLTIPHPYLRERNFYLRPLSEIASNERDPITGERIETLLKICEDKRKVWKTGNILQLKV